MKNRLQYLMGAATHAGPIEEIFNGLPELRIACSSRSRPCDEYHIPAILQLSEAEQLSESSLHPVPYYGVSYPSPY